MCTTPFTAGRSRRSLSAGLLSLLALTLAFYACAAPAPAEPVDALHVIATAHLDTQWRWTVRDTIRDFLPETLRANFEWFEKYPGYVFNFEGAFRYMLIKEYYPEQFETLKAHITAGNWSVCGGGLDGFDVNMPAPESLIRSMLYSQRFYRDAFGITARDLFMPDSFGFSHALPTIAKHCGMIGFSTQKLGWGCAAGIPFYFGAWQGVDGSILPAVLHAGPYNLLVREDLAASPGWKRRLAELREQSGVGVGFRYYGTGDKGGAPDEPSVAWVQGATRSEGGLRVISGASDRIFTGLTTNQISRLPRYDGELLMTTHGTGCYTSLGILKRWNRMCERRFDAAERASVAAAWWGGAPYPADRLRKAGIRFLWHQQHDGITGTSLPPANAIMLNDQAVSINAFDGILRHAVGSWSRALDTRAEGIPVVVYNPLAFAREEVVEARVAFPAGSPQGIRVFGPEGAEVLSQVVRQEGQQRTVLFVAPTPATGLAVYDVRPSLEPCPKEASSRASSGGLENVRYRVGLNARGDVASVYDKQSRRELLSAPIRFDRLLNAPGQWPAWEISYADISRPPLADEPLEVVVQVTESGPVRATITVLQAFSNATFNTRISLDSVQDAPLTFNSEIDWRADGELLKVRFPLACASEEATYDIGIGTASRGVNSEKLYEVPAQKWANLTAADGGYGIAVLADSKYGWDHPDADTLRLTLIHSPKGSGLDLGHHRVRYALAGHPGRWQEGVSRLAHRFDQPLLPFVSDAHAGTLGRRFSFVDVGDADVTMLTLKKVEQGDAILVRLAERAGREQKQVRVRFPSPVLRGRELNGLEDELGEANIEHNTLVADFLPYQIRTFAVTLAPPSACGSPAESVPLDLPYDVDVVAEPSEVGGGAFDAQGHAYAADLLPERLAWDGVEFRLGSGAVASNNAVSCRGQRVLLPAGDFNGVHILAAASGGDVRGTFRVGRQKHRLTVQDYGDDVGAARHSDARYDPDAESTIAWVGSHRVDAHGDRVPYTYSYLFRYELPYDGVSTVLTLPRDGDIRIFAISVANDPTVWVRAAAASQGWRSGPLRDPPPRGWMLSAVAALAVVALSLFAARRAAQRR